MPSQRRRSVATQNRLLLKIYSASRKFARGSVAQQDVDDVVHDVAVDCLQRLRTGVWDCPPTNLQAFVRKLVKAKIADSFRKRECDKEHDMEYLRVRRMYRPDWMVPDRIWSASEIAAFQDEVLSKLPRRCRLAYYMVRVEGSSYGEAARRLRVSRDVVHKEVSHAQRLFRKELRKLDVGSEPNAPNARPDDSAWRRNEQRFAPGYVANKQVAAIE